MYTLKMVRVSLVLATTVLIFMGCQKGAELGDMVSELEVAQATVSSESEIETEALFSNVFDNIMGVNEEVGLGTGIGIFTDPALQNGGVTTFQGGNGNGCYKITSSGAGFPKTITIDFGNGCKGIDGKTRKGKIITVYNGRMRNENSQSITTFDNYFVNEVKVEGKYTITNKNTATQRVFETSLENGKMIYPNGDFAASSFTRKITQTEGNETPEFLSDDVFRITGYSKGSAKKENVTSTWSSTISEPLLKKFTCDWITRGQIKVVKNNLTAHLYYGNGVCDNKAILTIEGVIKQIILK